MVNDALQPLHLKWGVGLGYPRSIAEKLQLVEVVLLVYVADSTGLGVPYRVGFQGPRTKLHTVTLLALKIVLVGG